MFVYAQICRTESHAHMLTKIVHASRKTREDQGKMAARALIGSTSGLSCSNSAFCSRSPQTWALVTSRAG